MGRAATCSVDEMDCDVNWRVSNVASFKNAHSNRTRSSDSRCSGLTVRLVILAILIRNTVTFWQVDYVPRQDKTTFHCCRFIPVATCCVVVVSVPLKRCCSRHVQYVDYRTSIADQMDYFPRDYRSGKVKAGIVGLSSWGQFCVRGCWVGFWRMASSPNT